MGSPEKLGAFRYLTFAGLGAEGQNVLNPHRNPKRKRVKVRSTFPRSRFGFRFAAAK